jgi:hypothetical protein
MITPGMSKQEIDQLFAANLEYGHPGSGGELIDDEAAMVIQEKLAGKGNNQQLLDSGEYIADFRGVEYWVKKKSGVWGKGTVGAIGVSLPAGAVLPDHLTDGQQREIEDQREAERVAALTPEQRAEEAAREKDNQIAEIQAKLAEIDVLDGPRPIREAVRDMAESAGLDTAFLMKHEAEAVALREQLAALMAA